MTRFEPWQKGACPHSRTGVCLAGEVSGCACLNGAGAYSRLLDTLNATRQDQLAIERPAWLYRRSDAVERSGDRKTVTLWTIYNHPKNIHLFVARRSTVPDDNAAEYLMLSSDLDAIRSQIATLGFTNYGRDPEDQPGIVEVWL